MTLLVDLLMLFGRSNALTETFRTRGSSENEDVDVFLEEADAVPLIVVVCVDDDRLGSAGCMRFFAWRARDSRTVECLV